MGDDIVRPVLVVLVVWFGLVGCMVGLLYGIYSVRERRDRRRAFEVVLEAERIAAAASHPSRS